MILPIVRYLDHSDVSHWAIQVWLRLFHRGSSLWQGKRNGSPLSVLHP
jgi:hypothetical protein